MKFKPFFLTAVLFTCHTFFAQQVGIRELNRVTDNLLREKQNQTKNAEGSQYVSEGFFMVNTPDFDRPFLARYNAFTDKIEVKDEGVLKPNKEITISSEDSKNNYVYVDYVDKENATQTGYLNLIKKNTKFNLLKRERIILEPASQPSNSYEQYRPARFKKMEPEYYYRIGDTAAQLLPKKKKDLEKLAPGKEKELNDFIKNNKISLSKEEDLIKLVVFLDSIL